MKTEQIFKFSGIKQPFNIVEVETEYSYEETETNAILFCVETSLGKTTKILEWLNKDGVNRIDSALTTNSREILEPLFYVEDNIPFDDIFDALDEILNQINYVYVPPVTELVQSVADGKCYWLKNVNTFCINGVDVLHYGNNKLFSVMDGIPTITICEALKEAGLWDTIEDHI